MSRRRGHADDSDSMYEDGEAINFSDYRRTPFSERVGLLADRKSNSTFLSRWLGREMAQFILLWLVIVIAVICIVSYVKPSVPLAIVETVKAGVNSSLATSTFQVLSRIPSFLRAAHPIEVPTKSGALPMLLEADTVDAYREALRTEQDRFCNWWGRHKPQMSAVSRQVLGDMVNYIVNLNFEFAEDRHAYVLQLEKWRATAGEQPVGMVDPACADACSRNVEHFAAPTGASGSHVEFRLTQLYRQALVHCMVCAQGDLHFTEKCSVNDMAPHVPVSEAATRLREGFKRLYDPSTELPFYLAQATSTSFAPFLSLLDTWAYAPQDLGAVFPLTDREAQIDIAPFKTQALRLQAASPPVETQIDGGLGGGMGVQLTCRPTRDSPPLLLLSSGGGGGRGYQLDVHPSLHVENARRLIRTQNGSYVNSPEDDLAVKSSTAALAPGAGGSKKECCNTQVQTCCLTAQGKSISGAVDKEVNANARLESGLRIIASQGGGGGMQVSFGKDPLTHQLPKDIDLSVGGGGGGGLSVIEGDFTESHGSQRDRNQKLPLDTMAFRQRLFRDMIHCMSNGDQADEPELWIVGGGGVGGGAHVALFRAKSAGPDPAMFGGGPRSASYAAVGLSADIGFGFSLRIPNQWFTQAPLHELTPSLGKKRVLDPTDRRPLPKPPVVPPIAPNPHAEGLFDSSQTLSAAASSCVSGCLHSFAAGAIAVANVEAAVRGAGELSPDLSGHVTSSGVLNTHSLFYGHCVCPCLQKALSSRHWASYLACSPLAIGTFDTASRGKLGQTGPSGTAAAIAAVAVAEQAEHDAPLRRTSMLENG